MSVLSWVAIFFRRSRKEIHQFSAWKHDYFPVCVYKFVFLSQLEEDSSGERWCLGESPPHLSVKVAHSILPYNVATFYLRRSGLIKARTESVVLLVVVAGGTVFQLPMYSFLGCEKAETLSQKGCDKEKNFVSKGVWKGKKLCLKKGCEKAKNFVSKRGVKRQNLESKWVCMAITSQNVGSISFPNGPLMWCANFF